MICDWSVQVSGSWAWNRCRISNRQPYYVCMYVYIYILICMYIYIYIMSLQYLYACIHRRTVPNHTLSATSPGLLRCLDPNKLMEFLRVFFSMFSCQKPSIFSPKPPWIGKKSPEISRFRHISPKRHVFSRSDHPASPDAAPHPGAGWPLGSPHDIEWLHDIAWISTADLPI